MRTRRLLPLLAVLLALLVPLLVWQAIEDPAHFDEAGPDLAASANEPVERGTRPGFSAATEAGPPVGTAARATLSARDPATEGIPIQRTIRAVDAATGAPVEGASVRAASLRELAGRDFDLDPEGALASAAESRTSREGEASLELAAGPALVAVRAEERFGFAIVEPGPAEPILVALHLDRTLSVATVDRAGQPVAGVPVVIRPTSPGLGPRSLWTGRTDARGIAVVRHLRARLGERPPTTDLEVALAFPTREPVSARIEPEGPSARVELVLPPCGAFEVLVRESDGSPAARAWARIARAEKDLAGDALAPGSFLPAAPTEAGRLLYPFVETGLALVVRVESKAGWRPVQAQGEGPREPGELARLEVAFQDPWPVLRGRLVDQRGSTLAARALRLRLGCGEPSLEAWAGRASTAADGSFRAVIDRAVTSSACQLEVSVEDANGSVSGVARESIAAALEGEVDLGTLVVEAIPALAAGRVVDDLGAPVAGAEIRVEREIRAALPGVLRLDHEPGLAARSGIDGRFELFGTLPAGACRIHALHAQYAPSEKRALTPGEREVELVLPRGAAIEGELLLDRGFDATALELEAVPRGASDDPGARFAATVRIDRSFRFASLRPGTWAIAVRFRGDRAPLASVPEVDVAAGQTTRIEAIDLRGALRVARIEVFEPTGERAASGWVRVRSPDGGSPLSSHAITGGLALVPLREPAVDLEIDVPACRRTVLEEVRSDQSVHLQRGVVLSLRLAGGAELPPPYRWGATVTDQPPPGVSVDAEGLGTPRATTRDTVRATVSFESDGQARFVLRQGGRWWIRLFVRDDSRRGRVEGVACSPAQVELPEAGGDATLVVAPLAGEVARALEALR